MADRHAKAIVLFERADLRSKLDRHAALEDYTAVQAVLDGDLLKFTEVSGAVPIGTSLHRMASIADELYALGAIADVVYVGVDVSEWKRAMADPEKLPYLERVLACCSTHVDST